jgi:hypothetical protein
LYGILRQEDLAKTNCFLEFVKRAWTRLSIPFENFKISKLEQEGELSQLQLK